MTVADLEGVLRRVRVEPCTLHGLTLTLGDVSVALTGEEFDAVWDAMDEAAGGLDAAIISLAAQPEGRDGP